MDGVDVQRVLRDDESVEVTLPAGNGRIVVTTHRVLAATPERDGPNLSYADRPNVEAVERENEGGTAHLARGVKACVVGLLLLGVGATVDLGGLITGTSVDSGTASQVGVGQVVAMLDALRAGLALLDVAMVAGGVLAVGFGLVSTSLFLRARQTALVVRVAGHDDLRVDAAVTDTDVAALRRRLELD
jgi:hypothetical protein